MKALGLLELEYDIVLSLAHHVHTFTYGKNWVKRECSWAGRQYPNAKLIKHNTNNLQGNCLLVRAVIENPDSLPLMKNSSIYTHSMKI